jgi:hypothetical protein
MGFVVRPDHLQIMRAYRHRGDLRSTTWQTDHFDRDATHAAARSLIAGWCAQPVRRG